MGTLGIDSDAVAMVGGPLRFRGRYGKPDRYASKDRKAQWDLALPKCVLMDDNAERKFMEK